MALFLYAVEDNVAAEAHRPGGRWGGRHEWNAPGNYRLNVETSNHAHDLHYTDALQLAYRLGLWVRAANVIAFQFSIILWDPSSSGHQRHEVGRGNVMYVP